MTRYESVVIEGKDYVHAYSDEGRYLVGGVPFSDKYVDALDAAELGRTYTEGDVMPVDEGEAQEILNILMGVDE